jgi:hypothetical protein
MLLCQCLSSCRRFVYRIHSNIEVGVNGSGSEQEVEVVVERFSSIALDSGIFQANAQAVEEILFVQIVKEYPMAVDPLCDHMVEDAGCADS